MSVTQAGNLQINKSVFSISLISTNYSTRAEVPRKMKIFTLIAQCSIFPKAAHLSRSLDGTAGGELFTFGALFAGACSPFTTRGRRLRLRIQKYKFWAEMRKSFWAGDHPGSSPRMLSTGASLHWWRTGLPRCHVRPGGRARGGRRDARQGPTSWNVGLPAAPERSMNAKEQGLYLWKMQFYTTLSANNCPVKTPPPKNYHIFGIPRT